MLQVKDDAGSALDASAAVGPPPPAAAAAAFAVALKLPDFWLHDPPSWFVHVEAQFALHGISADDMKYHHVVALLDPLATHRAMTLLWDPPTQGKYAVLKGLLLRHMPSPTQSVPKSFSPSQAWVVARLWSSWRTCCPLRPPLPPTAGCRESRPRQLSGCKGLPRPG